MSALLDRRAREHWKALTPAEQRETVCNLSDGGIGEYSIAAATGLSVEQVRRILAERRAT